MPSHARRRERLESLLTQIGVLLGGEAGARLSHDLGAPVSPDTILRLLYRMKIAPTGNPRVVDINNWACYKSVRCGTIVCDPEDGWARVAAAGGTGGGFCNVAGRSCRR